MNWNNRKISFYVWVYLISLFIYCSGDVMVRISAYPGYTTCFYRMLLAVPLTYPLARKQLSGISGRDWLLMMLLGTVFALDMAFWTLSLQNTRLINVQLFTGLASLLIVPASFYLFHERFSNTYLVGALLVVAGTALLTFGGGSALAHGTRRGDLQALLSGLLYIVYFLGSYRMRARIKPFALLFITTLGSIVPLFLLMCIFEQPVIPRGFVEWGPIVGLVVGNNLIGLGSQMFVMGRLSSSLIGLLLLAGHPFTATLGWLLFDERLNGWMLLGIVLTMAGTYFAQRKPLDRRAAVLTKTDQQEEIILSPRPVKKDTAVLKEIRVVTAEQLLETAEPLLEIKERAVDSADTLIAEESLPSAALEQAEQLTGQSTEGEASQPTPDQETTLIEAAEPPTVIENPPAVEEQTAEIK